MRALAPLAVAMLWYVPAGAQTITKAQCAQLAPAMQNMVLTFATVGAAAETDATKDLIPRLEGKLKATAIDAAAAAERFSQALKDYRIKMEEFGYQLQVCAR